MDIYLDNSDEGLSPETSHPAFVAVAPPEFYDESDDFTPFGSDDGNDALRDMEAWYEAEVKFGKGAQAADPMEFLTDLVAGWGFNLPSDALDLDPAALVARASADQQFETEVLAVSRARISAALGQLKITGAISPALLLEGRRGLRSLKILTADTSQYPDWPHRGEALASLGVIEAVLDRVDFKVA